jgi:hypothetical protein
MTRSEIQQCADCCENFCLTCDDEWRSCPDCSDRLCTECAAISLDMRLGRCISCFSEDDLTGQRFEYNPVSGRKMYKKYTEVQRGRGDE